jgi:hypothetical protein
LDSLYEASYVFLFLAVVCGFGTAELMHLFRKGYHPFLSGIIGSGIGLFAVYLMPFSFISATIIPIIAAILADIILTKVFDKADEKLSDAFENAADRERHYIIHGSDADKRVNYLRYHEKNHHGITTTIPPEQAMAVLEKAIGNSGFSSEYSDAKKEALEGERNSRIIQFSFSHAYIRLVVQKRENDTRVTIWKNSEATASMKYLDSLKLLKRVEIAWDSLYVLAKKAITELDPGAALDFLQNN